jgi:hypothetical protein
MSRAIDGIATFRDATADTTVASATQVTARTARVFAAEGALCSLVMVTVDPLDAFRC